MDQATGTHRPGAHRLRVFVSSPIGELAEERAVATEAIASLLLAPVLFDLGARPGSPRALYQAYLDHSDVFVGIYWQRYGWVAPNTTVSELEDQYDLSFDRPRLIYIKQPAPDRDPRLADFIQRIETTGGFSYKPFREPSELGSLLADDLALLLTERFDASARSRPAPGRPSTAAARPQLPAPPTPLVGREADVAALTQLLTGDETRLVTLSGPGGIGKTRLALEVATRLEDAFEHGVWHIPVATLRDPALVAPTIAFRLGIRESAGTSPFEALKGYLSEKKILLVIDNFERVVAAGPLVADLLAAAPGLTVLVTSRALLRVRGEREYPVQPLDVPTPDMAALLDRVPAVELFVERAQAANPSFRLTSDNMGAVAEICRRLEGLPLAIELAAARTRLLPPSALLARLTSRLSLLTGGASDLPERQRTLRAAIDWDYDLLDPAEQVLFTRLGLFVRGWTLESADAVTSVLDETGLDLLDGMDSLLGKSLVRQYPPEGMEPRFGMLETLREYALEKLAGSPDEAAVRRRHAEWHLQLAQDASEVLRGPDQALWLQRLEQEHDNLRAALRWADEQVEVEFELQLCAALADFWRVHAHFSEGRRWLDRALSLSLGLRTPLRADLLEGAAGLARARGDYAGVETLLREALEIRQELGDHNALATTLRLMGNARYELDDAEGAIQLWQQSLATRPEDGDRLTRAQTLNNLGVAARDRHDFDEAAKYYEEALAAFRELSDDEGIARVQMNLGNVMLDRDAPEEATELLRQAVHGFDSLGNTWDLVDSLDFLAASLAVRGEPLRAARLFGASEAIRDAIGATRNSVEAEEYGEHVARAKTAAGDDTAFAQEWSAGRAMPVDQVIAFALEDPQATA